MTIANHPAGPQYQVWYTPDGSAPSGRPLDVQSLTFVEEGAVIPLFDFDKYHPTHLAYGTRMVTGEIVFNFGQGHMDTLRSDTTGAAGTSAAAKLQTLRGGTLWVEMTRTEWSLRPTIVREKFRIDRIWEHPFLHTPDPIAHESVPFTARSLALVARESREVLAGALADFLQASDRFTYTPDDLIAPSVVELRATVPTTPVGKRGPVYDSADAIADGDTFFAEVDELGITIEVRPGGIDAPETGHYAYARNASGKLLDSEGTPIDESGNPPERLYEGGRPKYEPKFGKRTARGPWSWPGNATTHASGPSYGQAGQAPTESQLYGWAEVARERTRTLLAGKVIRLVAPMGMRPVDDALYAPGGTQSPGAYGTPTDTQGRPRYFFQVYAPTGGDPAEIDLEEALITEGLAVPFPSGAIEVSEAGRLVDRSARLYRLYREAQSKAGTPEAKGVWASFEPPAGF